MVARIDIDHDRLAEFCRRWKIHELALFGSVLREDFRPDSDVDVLVTFEPNAYVGFLEWPDFVAELEEMFQHRVDVVEKQSLRNPFLRHEILTTRRKVYVATQ